MALRGWVRIRDRVRGLARQLAGTLKPSVSEREMDEEVAFHIDMEAERLLREGVPPAEARRRAFVAFGGVERYQQQVRETRWTWTFVEGWRDARHAFGSLLRRPVFALTAAGTTAVAIGTATTFFSVLEAVVLRPLPVPDPERLVGIEILTTSGDRISVVSLPDYRDYRDQAEGVVALAAYHLADVTLYADDGAAAATLGFEVSSSYFDVLGVRPAVGRFFAGPEADAPGAPAEAVLGHDLWVARFGGDPSVVGKTVRLNGHELTVVGIAPEGFQGVLLGVRPAVYVPLGLHPRLQGAEVEDRTSREWLRLLGRLRPGVSREQAEAALEVVAARLVAAYDYREQVEPRALVVEALSPLPPRARDTAARFVSVLLGAAIALLLVAVVNVAGMLLARSAERAREIAVRLALGAGRGRVAGQLLVEGLVLGLLAGAGGAAVALVGVRLVQAVEPPGAPGFYIDLRVHGVVLAFASACALLCSLMFGLIPAVHATRSDLAGVLRRATGGRSVSRVRSTLVGSQVALTLVLLVSTGLLVRTLRNALTVEHGFDPHGVVLAEMNLRLSGYDEPRGRAFYETLLERLRASPAVASAGLSTSYPLGVSWDQTRVVVAGLEPSDPAGWPVGWAAVSDGYFETLGLRLRSGAAPDARTPPLRIVVNDELVERFWRGQAPLGRGMRFGDQDAEVVGVAPSGRYRSLAEEPRMFAWVPLEHSYTPALYVHVRPRGAPGDAMAELRRAVASLDPQVPIINLTTLEEAMGQSMFLQRIAASLVGAFGFVGLLLSGTGILGLLAYVVEARRREIGIRMAVGASGPAVIRSVVGRGMRPVLLGLGAGLVVAVAAAGALESLLYDVAPRDPLSFGSAALLLLGAAALAAWIPARRAARTDPAATLNAD